MLVCHRYAIVLFASSVAMTACSGADDLDLDVADHHVHEEDGPIGTTAQALVASDPVSAAVTQACSTTAVRGLSTQLVEEIQCMRPGTMKRIDNTPGLSLGAAVFPYLQTPAANALIAAQKARGTTMSINSGLRTLPQQYLLYRWYQTGRCNIRLAARPGTSNHESAVAVDINDNAGWRNAMSSQSYRWLGANDPVHFDYVGGGTVAMNGLSVRAFQRLWNRNNPNDTIAEDGAYGPMTAARLERSPVGGFATGALCNMPKTDDAGGDDADEADEADTDDSGELPRIPDATEHGDAPPAQETTSAEVTSAPLPPLETESAGCATAPVRAPGGAPAGALLAAAALALAAARRRRALQN
jgi:MYXO-CTERM domain-containing protein